jgi:multimeric flavodoxin WrbA
MLESDALVLTTPVYALRESGGVKAFLDHFSYLFFVHRARPEMFHKKAFVLSTTGGAGAKSAIKAISISLKYWGINRVYSKGFVMISADWKNLKTKKKTKYERVIQRRARKFWKDVSSKKDHLPYLKTRVMFFIRKQSHKTLKDDTIDYQYWKAQGWLDGTSPFKKS